MNLEDLIPKFEVGERVIYHQQPVEFVCPACGRRYGTEVPQRDYDCEVIGPPHERIFCSACLADFPTPEGWIKLKLLDFDETGVVPFTLLERVEGSR